MAWMLLHPAKYLCGQNTQADKDSGSSNASELVLPPKPPFQQPEFGPIPPPHSVLPGEQWLIEQVEDLIRSEEFGEAIQHLESTFDNSAGRLVQVSEVQSAGTLRTRRFVDLREWAASRLTRLLLANPAVQQEYQDKRARAAELAYQELAQSKDVVATQRALWRYCGTSVGPQLARLLADLYLEHGWGIATRQAAESLSPELRYPLLAPPTVAANGNSAELPIQPSEFMEDNLSTPIVFRANGRRSEESWQRLRLMLERPTLSGEDRTELLIQGLTRILRASQLDSTAVSSEWQAWVSQLAKTRWGSDFQTLLGRNTPDISQAASSRELEWKTFAGSSSRGTQRSGKVADYELEMFPSWSRELERFTATADLTPASRPRVGEDESGVLYCHPVVARVGDQRLVFVNELTSIAAYDWQTGRPWPDVLPSRPVFDSRIAAAAYVPVGYPLQGTPRGTLSVVGHQMFARMGDPVTGWANSEAASDGGSRSYIVGLDLRRQGSMLAGYPIRLKPPEFENAELEGCPLVWQDLLLVAVVQRDDVGLRRSVVAFERDSGELKWRSPTLSAGSVLGSERANLISHQLLSAAGGRIYYSTNLGAVACLDPLSGRVIWLTQYEVDRASVIPQEVPEMGSRFRYRDLTPCLVAEGVVYCAPQDCAEVFALDASTGDLMWATDREQMHDTTHLLGLNKNHLIVSGDRIMWLNRQTGKLLARYPDSNTPGALHALPSPRGMGRGKLCNGRVYWPTRGELLVLDMKLPSPHPFTKLSQPRILQRFPMGARGRDGGNVIILDQQLLYAGASRLLAFKLNTQKTQ